MGERALTHVFVALCPAGQAPKSEAWITLPHFGRISLRSGEWTDPGDTAMPGQGQGPHLVSENITKKMNQAKEPWGPKVLLPSESSDMGSNPYEPLWWTPGNDPTDVSDPQKCLEMSLTKSDRSGRETGENVHFQTVCLEQGRKFFQKFPTMGGNHSKSA